MGPVFNVHSHKASLSQTSPHSQSQEEHTHSMEGHHNIQTLTCSLPLVSTSLLVGSLGGLLRSRLMERLEGHMEDAHCADSAMKTQATSKVSVLRSRACCRMRPHACVISPGFVLPLALPLGLSVFTHVLLQPGIAALPVPPFLSLLHHSSCHPASRPSEGEPAVLGGGSWLADQLPRDFCQNSELGLVQLSRLLALPIHQPLLSCFFRLVS